MPANTQKAVLRLLSSGLYVLTTQHGDQIAAATVSWLTQVSFEPPLVMVALRQESRIHDLTRAGGRFGVNVLGQDQQEIAQAFFKPARVEPGTLSGYAYRPGQEECPILVDVPAWFECRVVEVHAGQGDHTLFIGLVTATGLAPDAGPTLALRDTPWSYGG